MQHDLWSTSPMFWSDGPKSIFWHLVCFCCPQCVFCYVTDSNLSRFGIDRCHSKTCCQSFAWNTHCLQFFPAHWEQQTYAVDKKFSKDQYNAMKNYGNELSITIFLFIVVGINCLKKIVHICLTVQTILCKPGKPKISTWFLPLDCRTVH